MAKSDYLEQKILDYIFNDQAFAAPQTFVSLYLSSPADDDSGTEASGTDYAREEVHENAGSSPYWNLAVIDGIGYLVDNLQAIVFTVAGSGGWGTISHFGIHDAVSVGNLLYHGALTVPQAVNEGSTFEFAAGDCNVREE
jgi:hypothetical protein